MKKFHQFLITSLILGVMSSCGDDDDDDSNSIVGDWSSTIFSVTDCQDGSSDILDFPCGGCFVNEYDSDGTFSSRVLVPGEIDSTMVGTYTINGSMLTTCDEDGANCETNNFEITDDQLVITGEGLGCMLELIMERS